jgi:hypothetical protein
LSERRIPVPALIVLMAFAASGTILALAYVPDRGDDFRRLYFSAVNWAHGGDPYAIVIGDTPNLNHPTLLPFLWLFTWMSPEHAFVVWSIMSLGLLLACVTEIGRIARVHAIELLALVLASGAGFLALGYGQVTFVVMALFTAAWSADRRGQATTAGGLLGILSALKPFFGLFLLYLAWRRQWRAIAAYVGSFVTVMMAGWAIAGTSGFFGWLSRLRDVQWRWHIYNASVWGLADRLFSMHPYAERWTPLLNMPRLAAAVTVVLLAVVAAILWRASRFADLDSSYALYGVASILLSPLGWLYYVPAFLGPVVLVLKDRPSRWLWALGVLSAWPYLFLVGTLHGKIGTLTIGHWAFENVLGLFVLVVMFRRTVDRSDIRTNSLVAPSLDRV